LLAARSTLSTNPATAIVTGGASGIGRALTEQLAARGVATIIADRQIGLARHVADGITRRGGRSEAIELDVRNALEFKAVVQHALTQNGRLDYLFNNAGIGVVGEMLHYAPSDWNDVLDVNLNGIIHGIAAAYPVMVNQRSGHIVNTSSLAGLLGVPLIGSYTASKFAVVGLSMALRLEARRHGVRVSVICPGIVRTPILTASCYSRVNRDAVHLAAHYQTLDRLACDPTHFATRVLSAVDRDRGVIVEPLAARVVWRLNQISPTLVQRVIELIWRRMQRQSGFRAETYK
jgi:NAD(P)-dependent dehydrogenase (short-subunit alcohol dehydrogenase family)